MGSEGVGKLKKLFEAGGNDSSTISASGKADARRVSYTCPPLRMEL